MLPAAWPWAVPQGSTHLWHRATELGEDYGGGHKAELWGIWVLKSILLNTPIPLLHQGLKSC